MSFVRLERMDHKGRQNRLQANLELNRLDALLITHAPNVRYLCGFTGSAGAVILSEAKSVFFTDGRYKEQASLEVQGSRVVVTRK